MTTITELHEVNRKAREFVADVTVSCTKAGDDLKAVPFSELDSLVAQGNSLAWTEITDRTLVTQTRDIMVALRIEHASRTPSKETAMTCSHIKPAILPTTPDVEAFPFIGALIHGATIVEIDRWIGRTAIHNLKTRYSNGYTASINHLGEGHWEIAVMRDGQCVYDTDIMDNSLIRTGDPLHVAEVGARIAALPAR